MSLVRTLSVRAVGVVGCVLVALLTLVGLLVPRPAYAATPSVVLASGTGVVGEWLNVDLSGFSPGPVQLELCSASTPETSSTSCDLSGAGQVTVEEDGSGSGMILVGEPPGSCPCVVLARSLQSSDTAQASIELGAGSAADEAGEDTGPVAGTDDPIGPVEDGQLSLAARFESPSGVAAVLGRFFGWETRFTLQVGVANLGESGVSGGSAEIWAFSADRATPRLVGQLDVPALPAGDHGSVETQVVLPGPVLTPTTVWLRPYGVGPDQTVTTVVSDRSWGLIAVAAIVLALVMVLAGRIGYGLVAAILHRKQPPRAPRRTGWRPSLVGVAVALIVMAVAVVVQAVSEDRAARAHWLAQRADGLVDAGARTATPTIALPTADGAADWRVLDGLGPAVLTAGVGRWPGSDRSPVLVAVGDQPEAPFARLGELQPGEVIVLRQPDGATTTYRVETVAHPVSGTPVTGGQARELTLWSISSAPDARTDIVVRAAQVG